jgi:hypothetical protein
MEDKIIEAFHKARKLLEQNNHELSGLPTSVITFLLVHGAQGTIDNGGFRYFFGADWPNNPPYSQFIEAYKTIGCEAQAKELERVVATFPFKNPHLYEEWRKKYMADNYDDEELEVKGWGEDLCGDEEVWAKLEEFYIENIQDFA